MKIQIFHDHGELSQAVANLILELALEAVASRGKFQLVLSGGGTPRPLYKLLSQPPYTSSMPWSKTHLFWGDERCVPSNQPGSNYGQTRVLLLDHVPLLPGNVHRIRGELEPSEAVELHAKELQELAEDGLAWPRFDLVLLGMGDDGHMASIFPGRPPQEEANKAVIAVKADYEDRPADRVTLTPQVFNTARNVFFMVVGPNKARTLQAVLEGPNDPLRWPVHRIRPKNTRVIWFLDEPAASRLDDSTRIRS